MRAWLMLTLLCFTVTYNAANRLNDSFSQSLEGMCHSSLVMGSEHRCSARLIIHY